MSDTQYKLVNGELVPLTPEDLAQIEQDRSRPGPPPRVELPQPTRLDADPYADMDAVTKRYLDDQIAELRREIDHG